MPDYISSKAGAEVFFLQEDVNVREPPLLCHAYPVVQAKLQFKILGIIITRKGRQMMNRRLVAGLPDWLHFSNAL